MVKLFGILAAMTASLGSSPGTAPPVRFVAEPVAQGIRIQVIGAGETGYEASFELEVTSEGNRSLHRGSVILEAGQPVVLSTITVGLEPGRSWRASLKVAPKGRQGYEQVETSS